MLNLQASVTPITPNLMNDFQVGSGNWCSCTAHISFYDHTHVLGDKFGEFPIIEKAQESLNGRFSCIIDSLVLLEHLGMAFIK